jgi:hypothetical protein
LSTPLKELARSIPGLSGWGHTQKIKFFAWYVHSQLAQERFNQVDIRNCYDALHLDKPTDVSPYLAKLEQKKPREVIRDRRGYYLEGRVREELEAKYGQREITVQVTKLLADLPGKVQSLEERTFLAEALTCFRYGAFRAAIVMCWNLTYDHLCDYVLRNHLTAFNNRWPLRFPNQHKKARVAAISSRDDFSELKEYEMLEVCKAANIITADVFKILDEKLGKRNTAAHANGVVFTQLQAEDFISDLVNNVVLPLS